MSLILHTSQPYTALPHAIAPALVQSALPAPRRTGIRRNRWFLLALALGILLAFWPTTPASAQTGVITVTTTLEDIQSDGLCSLAEAVENANAAAALHTDCAAGGPDNTRILLAPGAVYSYTVPHTNLLGNTALPPITSDITVVGSGATLTRAITPTAQSMRFFAVTVSGTLTLEQVTLTRGNPLVASTVVIFVDGGAIYNAGTLHLHNSVLHDNQAANGGAIFSEAGASTYLVGSTLHSNQAILNGGAIAAHGPLHVHHSMLNANLAQDGNGGAIYAHTPISPTVISMPVNIHASTLYSNTAASGGGVYHVGGNLSIANSTLTRNQAVGTGAPATAIGGALANGDAALTTPVTSTVSIINSSLVSNTAAYAGGALSNRHGLAATAQITVQNSILAFNTATQPSTHTCSTDQTLTIASAGNNLESGNSCGFNQTSDLLNTNPRLEALADNGGPTPTHALRPSSPAIGKGNPAVCVAPPINQHDQRGVLRLSVVCDIGAYEFDVGKKLAPILMVGPKDEEPAEEQPAPDPDPEPDPELESDPE